MFFWRDWKEFEEDFESVSKDDIVELNGDLNVHLYRAERAKVLYEFSSIILDVL